MSDIGEMWNEHRTEQKERRRKRLPGRQDAILALRSLGYRVVEKTAYHFRINDCLDVYPIHQRFHDLRTGQRGNYRDIIDFTKKRIPI